MVYVIWECSGRGETTHEFLPSRRKIFSQHQRLYQSVLWHCLMFVCNEFQTSLLKLDLCVFHMLYKLQIYANELCHVQFDTILVQSCTKTMQISILYSLHSVLYLSILRKLKVLLPCFASFSYVG